MALELVHENIWYDKWRYDDAECQYYEKQYGASAGLGSLVDQISKTREVIRNSLATFGDHKSNKGASTSTSAAGMNLPPDLLNRITKLEGTNTSLLKTVSHLEKSISELTKRLSAIECKGNLTPSAIKAPPSTPKEPETQEEDEVDLFGSDDEEDDEAARVREERLKAYADKKAKKPGPIAKSSVLLDCKPWDDETDMKAMEAKIRSIVIDGLVWGAAKLVPLAYGIQKLSILCTVEDEKVSIDDLMEKITEFEDYVQSVDIAAFNKI